IPGPVEVSDNVLTALAQPPLSHVSPDFARIFQQALLLSRKVVGSQYGQPFIIAGSGTLGWDQVGANLVERGDNVLVLNTGYFGNGFRDCLLSYGAQVTTLNAPALGETVPLSAIEAALTAQNYKLVTVTHVDTSTGVLSDIKGIAGLVRRVSPSTLIVLDGVCSVGCEEIKMDLWGLDIVLTASQKAIGAPPGLSILIASHRAIKTYRSRQTPVQGYYASWKKWLPIMESYLIAKPAYFGTQAVNLVCALTEALSELIKGGEEGLAGRIEAHRKAARRLRAVAAQLGMKSLAVRGAEAAGLTAIWVPEGLTAAEILQKAGAKGVVFAGGLLADVKDRYIRIGHMGVSVADEDRGDVDRICDVLHAVIGELLNQKRAEGTTT
ncbi:Alanine--glyoxylate aminotransferase 1, partial [Leucoagaricus sp. SymC.cos]